MEFIDGVSGESADENLNMIPGSQNLFMASVDEVVDSTPTLYKFFKFNELTLYALTESYLWFSTADKFNDPFEGLTHIYLGEDFLETAFYIESLHQHSEQMALKSEYIRSPNEVRRRFLEKYRKAYREDFKRIQKYGFCCFLSGQEQGRLSVDQEMMMWGHYTSGLRGFRIIYDTRRLIDSIDDADIYKIKYNDEPRRIELSSYIYETRVSGAGPRTKHSFDQSHFTSKYTAWSYEKEVRLRRNNEGPRRFDVKSIIGIDFGFKMTYSQIALIQKLFRTADQISYRIAYTADDSYNVEYAALDHWSIVNQS